MKGLDSSDRPKPRKNTKNTNYFVFIVTVLFVMPFKKNKKRNVENLQLFHESSLTLPHVHVHESFQTLYLVMCVD